MIGDDEFMRMKDADLAEAWTSFWAQLGERLDPQAMAVVAPLKQTMYSAFGFGFNMGVKFTCKVARLDFDTPKEGGS